MESWLVHIMFIPDTKRRSTDANRRVPTSSAHFRYLLQRPILSLLTSPRPCSRSRMQKPYDAHQGAGNLTEELPHMTQCDTRLVGVTSIEFSRLEPFLFLPKKAVRLHSHCRS